MLQTWRRLYVFWKSYGTRTELCEHPHPRDNYCTLPHTAHLRKAMAWGVPVIFENKSWSSGSEKQHRERESRNGFYVHIPFLVATPWKKEITKVVWDFSFFGVSLFGESCTTVATFTSVSQILENCYDWHKALKITNRHPWEQECVFRRDMPLQKWGCAGRYPQKSSVSGECNPRKWKKWETKGGMGGWN